MFRVSQLCKVRNLEYPNQFKFNIFRHEQNTVACKLHKRSNNVTNDMIYITPVLRNLRQTQELKLDIYMTKKRFHYKDLVILFHLRLQSSNVT